MPLFSEVKNIAVRKYSADLIKSQEKYRHKPALYQSTIVVKK
jgi:hypothetical protein